MTKLENCRTVAQDNPKDYRSTVMRSMQVLTYIAFNGEVNNRILGTECNMSYTTVKCLLDFFVENDIVKKTYISKKKYEIFSYSITPKGKEVVDKFEPLKPFLEKIDNLKEIRY